MQEIKCPKCGEVFQVDESGYAAIVRQVRDKEFEKELSERKAQYHICTGNCGQGYRPGGFQSSCPERKADQRNGPADL